MDVDSTRNSLRPKYSMDDITRFLAGRLRIDPAKLNAHTDIERDIGCTGDDFFELMEHYTQEFTVNLETYHWYFHHGPEAGLGPDVRLPDGQPIAHSPITPQILLDSANTGRWTVVYPAHIAPKPLEISIGRRFRLGTVALFLLGLALAAGYVWLAVNVHR